MKHNTFELLKDAHLGNPDKDALIEAKRHETDPFINHYIDIHLNNENLRVSWAIEGFTTQFRAAYHFQRLDETVLSFILRLAAIVREEAYIRSFRKPESFPAWLAWEHLLKNCMQCILGLLYNIKWTQQNLLMLDKCILEMISKGNPFALRDFMKSCGVILVEKIYPAEKLFEKLNFLHVGQFSAFFWRLLHWMAEAHTVREGMEFEKKMWREIVVGPLYRTLRCGICMIHLKNMIEEKKAELLNPSTNHPELWFSIHNKVHAQRRDQYKFLMEPDYLESEYKADSEFMRQVLE